MSTQTIRLPSHDLKIWEVVVAKVGWFIPPYMPMGKLNDLLNKLQALPTINNQQSKSVRTDFNDALQASLSSINGD